VITVIVATIRVSVASVCYKFAFVDV